MKQNESIVTTGHNRVEQQPLINRVEVIGKGGRLFVKDPRCGNKINGVELSYQDDGKTLKIFLNEE